MKDDELPIEANVVHYVSPSRVTDTGEVTWAAFSKPSGQMPSVHWLEQFEGSTDEQLKSVRRVSRLNRRRNGRFAELSVGDVVGIHPTIKVLHDPLQATLIFKEDPSHSNITGLPRRDDPREKLVCEQMAKFVKRNLHPAVLD